MKEIIFLIVTASDLIQLERGNPCRGIGNTPIKYMPKKSLDLGSRKRLNIIFQALQLREELRMGTALALANCNRCSELRR